MAWSTPLTAVSNAALTAAQWNASVRDNLLETASAKATTAGGYFASTGVNTLGERIPQVVTVSATETTTSTSYVDLTTAGPGITATVSGFAMVVLSAIVSNNTVNASAYMGVDISGVSSVAANDGRALEQTSSTANAGISASYVALYGLTAGSNVFAAKYRATSGTASFGSRRMIVFPY